jgi:tetratricopeptide (TPR) repeat protein/MinD-like ATPase involved in chromosome partitioning or flagellar assembly
VRTVTFYSYKGGTGRSLLVANVGVLAARLGMRVILVDLDLEAPGLPYKFPSQPFKGPGVVEWLTSAERPDVEELIQPIQLDSPFLSGGELLLITASDKPSRRYLQAMRQIQEGPLNGDANIAATALLALKDAIEEYVSPDLLLIDSRTGITTTNAITTRILADEIAVLTLNTNEQLDGTREVLRSLTPLDRPRGHGEPLGLHVIVSRVSRPKDAATYEYSESERRTIRDVQLFLTEPAVPLVTTVRESRISLLHNDAEVADREQLLMSRNDAETSIALHVDYLKFARALLGPTMNDRIEKALQTAGSDQQRDRWLRFFGRAQPATHRGTTLEVPENLIPVVPRNVPIATIVSELRRVENPNASQKFALANALHEYGSALRSAAENGEARRALTESIDTYESILSDHRRITSNEDPPESAVVGVGLAAAALSDVEKSDGDLAQASLTLLRGLDVIQAVRNPSQMLLELDAQLSSMYGILLLQAGEPAKARDAVKHGVTTLMPRWQPGSPLDEWYLPELDPARRGAESIAAMLGLLALCYLRQGDERDAVATAESATAVWRRYAESDSSAKAAASLGKSLSNLGNYLRVANRLEQAESTLTEAVDVLRPNADESDDDLNSLAAALESLAAVYGDLGRNDIALATAEQALHFRRDLFEGDQGRYAVPLASALNNVSAQYGALDDHVQAAERAREAVSILTGHDESASSPELLAAALNNLALSTLRAGDPEASVWAAEAAVKAYRNLSTARPGWTRTHTARALLNLSLAYSALGSHGPAAEAARDAVNAASEVAKSEPALYANCLGVLGSRLHTAEEYESAAEAARLAVNEYRKLTRQDEGRYATTLAAVLDTLASALLALGDEVGAAEASTESRKIFRNALREF